MHRYQIGDRVRLEGIGRGKVLSLDVYQGRPFYLVRFKLSAEPHLCAEAELTDSRKHAADRQMDELERRRDC
jgi:hypothetical protein